MYFNFFKNFIFLLIVNLNFFWRNSAVFFFFCNNLLYLLAKNILRLYLVQWFFNVSGIVERRYLTNVEFFCAGHAPRVCDVSQFGGFMWDASRLKEGDGLGLNFGEQDFFWKLCNLYMRRGKRYAALRVIGCVFNFLVYYLFDKFRLSRIGLLGFIFKYVARVIVGVKIRKLRKFYGTIDLCVPVRAAQRLPLTINWFYRFLGRAEYTAENLWVRVFLDFFNIYARRTKFYSYIANAHNNVQMLKRGQNKFKRIKLMQKRAGLYK